MAKPDVLAALEPLIGTWSVEATFPGRPPVGGGTCVVEWILDRSCLRMRTTFDIPTPPPESESIVAIDRAGERAGQLTQHYFDARGVARLYAMTFDGRTWTLAREREDFSPFDFAQRFRAVLDGDELRGAWETRAPGGDWALDFELRYHRLRAS